MSRVSASNNPYDATVENREGRELIRRLRRNRADAPRSSVTLLIAKVTFYRSPACADLLLWQKRTCRAGRRHEAAPISTPVVSKLEAKYTGSFVRNVCIDL